ncbi:GTPase HflX [Candidatus Dependentiae bacterium]|nr:GTPase HflX [Candidatus Dependentiae bacterium]
MASKKPISTTQKRTNVLLLTIHAPYNHELSREDYESEFSSLVETLGVEYEEDMTIKLRRIDKSNFLTKGKLLDVLAVCNEKKIDEVIVSELLSPLQERNLEDFFGCTVYDRERLILEIFQNAAHTAEGKIQVEMAQLEYFKTRLAGKGAQLAQQAGHIGTRGPGETEKEYLKRHLTEKHRQAKKRLLALQKSRDVQRKRRLASKLPLICLVGYTNVGKSSIINLLTKSDVLAEDKLFATLDTTTRELFVDSKKIGLLSDTVGFISQLPHHLIEAFKSTLDELQYADLMLHVVDVSNKSWPGQIEIVLGTLCDLGVDQKPMLYVFNKTDKLSDQELEELRNEIEAYQPHALTHATSKDGLAELIEALKNHTFS